ncbi:MAG TPA: M4 family metallopeptidase, partial [Saprospiraceae bacterium]|nr:M4 family metallopeptidase [Saprospiraceae bacterium]
GDGNDNPLTGIDVVSHELTHGVTGNSSRLIYRNESGALNESFSDIFGNTVERYALGDSADWLIGRENYTLRDMSNPNAFGDPDTYRGENWWTSAENNGGVHTNSGVMNYWFHLMAEGGVGTNDNDLSYAVDGVGFYEAAQISHRNNVFYLVPSSNYEDARIGALLSAEDIYGSCSNEVEQVALAWNAVGVGPAEVTQNLRILNIQSPISSCAGENASELNVAFELRRSGCNFQLAAEDSLNIGYRLRNGNVYQESFVVGTQFVEGDQRTFSFELPTPLVDPGSYKMDVWVAFNNGTGLNDTLFNYEVKIPEVINDEALITFEPFSGSVDSFFVENGDKAQVLFPQSLEASEGFSFGRLTGTEIVDPGDLDIPMNSSELFDRNKPYGSRLCFCADLPDWEEGATLEFDMKQTWSSIYRLYGFSESSRLVGMRILADDELLAGPFYPQAHIDAEWERKKVDLSSYLNRSVSLCFEGRHFIEKDEDPMDNSDGDKTDIDQLRITKGFSTSTNELVDYKFALYPNPNQGSFILTVPRALELKSLRIVDATGRRVYEQAVNTSSTSLSWQLNTNLPQGVYIMEVEGEKGIFRERFVISQ